MLASLSREFRKKARKGGTTAVVVRGNPDGSLKVTESLFGNLPDRLADAAGCPDVTDLLRPACFAPGARVLMIRVCDSQEQRRTRVCPGYAGRVR